MTSSGVWYIQIRDATSDEQVSVSCAACQFRVHFQIDIPHHRRFINGDYFSLATREDGVCEAVFGEESRANAKAVIDAWKADGREGTVSATLVNKMRGALGLAGNLRATRRNRSAARRGNWSWSRISRAARQTVPWLPATRPAARRSTGTGSKQERASSSSTSRQVPLLGRWKSWNPISIACCSRS